MNELAAEVAYLHKAVFCRQKLDDAIVERYELAHRSLLIEAPSEEQRTVRMVVEQKLDVLAVEFALRRRRTTQHHLLTMKLQILFYLVEVRSHYFRSFFNLSSHPIKGTFALMGSIILSIWRAVKGFYLVWRYRFA